MGWGAHAVPHPIVTPHLSEGEAPTVQGNEAMVGMLCAAVLFVVGHQDGVKRGEGTAASPWLRGAAKLGEVCVPERRRPTTTSGVLYVRSAASHLPA